MNKEEVLFPYDEIRNVQDELIEEIERAVNNKESLVVHAPTGLGKTVASLGPALKKAEEENLTVFFLTSRHTQHKIAIDTLEAIKKKYGLSIPVVDIIGKKHMCLQPGINLLSSGEFSEYCKKAREENSCEFYSEARKKDGSPTVKAEKVTRDLINLSPLYVEGVIQEGEKEGMCPYELSMLLAKKAKVVVADYFYVFNPNIMEAFFKKAEKDLCNSIVIVDEAHNLPGRLREVMSSKLTTKILKYARNEANELDDDECVVALNEIQETMLQKLDKDEQVVKGLKFLKVEEKVEMFEEAGEKTLKNKKRSYLVGIAKFLSKYKDKEGFVNILRSVKTDKGNFVELNHNCMDPSLLSQPVFDVAYSTIIMSGTLQPISMFKDLLGVKSGKEFPSPFPKKNRLKMVLPLATTKYSSRNVDEYKKMAEIISKIIDSVPGNSAIFFPSYYFRDQIYPFMEVKKTLFTEVPSMSKQEKEEMLDKFKEYSLYGAGLLGVASGSFGEGVDLPGDLLKCVVVVGLPLSKPDLETEALIQYYDHKFGKGWDYGYVLPAISTVLQNAGRCIRSENDKGVIIFLDSRYAWDRYKSSLGDVEVDTNYEERINEFFEK